MDTKDARQFKMELTTAEQQQVKQTTLSYSYSLVTQGKHTFFTLTVPSEVLARTCFVSTRYEDPKLGFQRILDEKRAREIAEYIDVGLGTIPNSIVLSAQLEAELRPDPHRKTLQFNDIPKAFLILDGQHRVYGFSMAKTSLRVPVVIYRGLTRQQETRLFIDINTKQRPVPNELLLDIKQLAEYETTIEQRLRELFDLFNSSTDSFLMGLMNPISHQAHKISRVTFNSAIKPLVNQYATRDNEFIFNALNSYLKAFGVGIESTQAEVARTITNPTVFRAIMLLFPEVALRVKDRRGPEYSQDNFWEVLEPMFSTLKASFFKNPGHSATELKEAFTKAFKTEFSL